MLIYLFSRGFVANVFFFFFLNRRSLCSMPVSFLPFILKLFELFLLFFFGFRHDSFVHDICLVNLFEGFFFLFLMEKDVCFLVQFTHLFDKILKGKTW